MQKSLRMRKKNKEKKIRYKNSVSQLIYLEKLFSKMAVISDTDWAQHIMMDYAQNLRKDPTKAKKITFRRFTGCLIVECLF